jgi:outer membrane murein-binding lipoprotein Lpp
MRTAIVIAVGLGICLGAGLTLLGGCSSKTDEVDTLRREQNRAIEQVGRDVEAMRHRVERLDGDIKDMQVELFELERKVATELVAVRGGEEPGPSERTDGGEAAPDNGTPPRVQIEPLEVSTLGELAGEVAKLKAELTQLRDQYQSEKELEALRDPRQTWEAMNDPEKLTERLERFERVWSPKIEDGATRAQFQTDVQAVVDQMKTRAAMSRDELLAHYRVKLTDRINTETNQRMRQWYEQQLRTLDSGNERVVETQLTTFQRYDTVQALKEVAEKYKVSNEDLRDNGLQTYGGAYGWQ